MKENVKEKILSSWGAEGGDCVKREQLLVALVNDQHCFKTASKWAREHPDARGYIGFGKKLGADWKPLYSDSIFYWVSAGHATRVKDRVQDIDAMLFQLILEEQPHERRL